MKTTLYNIKEDYAALMDAIEEQEGVLTDEQNDQLVINEQQRDQKSIAYLEVIKDREAFIGNIDEEIKRLQALKKRNNTLIDTLKNNLLGAVELFGEFTVGTVTFTTRKSESIIVEDVNILPKEYKTIKVTESANKADLKKAIKAGKEIEGVILQTNFNLNTK
jgi:translation initiation factor 2 beta subunit (eIF-2beta)/eIF-5